jgi:hypothetical protein
MTRRTRSRLVLLAAIVAAVGVFAAVGDATTMATKPSNTSPPSVTGTARQGQTLTSTSGSWSGTTPMTFSYAWQRCDTTGANCSTIGGANGQTYVISGDDVGHTLRSQVTAKNSAGSTSATSNHTAKVVGSNPPKNGSRPVISGTPEIGNTLKTSNGSWSGTAPISYAYDWRRCDANGNSCSSIDLHSDNQTYTPVDADLGHTLRVVVTATNGGGSAQATSNATAVVRAGKPGNTAAPAITGSAVVGQTLTASNGTWSGSPTSYTYAWTRCDGTGNCPAISGATGTKYATTSADLGKFMRVVVTAKNAAGSTAATSPPFGPIVSAASTTGAIAAANVPDTDQLTITSVKYAPTAIHGRGPVIATIKVMDGKRPVSGALVYVLPVPRAWASHPGEVPTSAAGTASVQLTLNRSAPKSGWLLLFIRARTPQGNLLAGSSTRRLVQVRIKAS